MSTVLVESKPWGECFEKGCHVLSVRCYHGRCATHCEKRCKDSTGVKTHSQRPKAEEARLVPSYVPPKPKLVATTHFTKETAA